MHPKRENATSEQVANLFIYQCLEVEHQSAGCWMERCITCESRGQVRLGVGGCRFKYIYMTGKDMHMPQGENSHDLQRHMSVS